jgi:two-component system, sensor histidine kinase and response regulator
VLRIAKTAFFKSLVLRSSIHFKFFFRGLVIAVDAENTEAALKAALLRSKAAEASLLREREMQATVAAMARIGSWELDLPTMTMIWSNEVYRLHEVDPAIRPSLRDALNFVAADFRINIETAVRDALEKGQAYELTVPLKTRSGKSLWVRVMGVTETRNGVVTRLYGALQDVTAQRDADEARLAALAAEAAASRAKADFLANMSHEIRTPMNGVIGMTELLLDTPLQPMQKEFAETIHNSASALLIIVNDILDFSRIESGKLEIERVDMSVRECVEDVGITLAAQTIGRDVEIVVNIDASIPERLLGDAIRLRQIIMNLAGNALKFTTSGEVVIEVFPIALRNGRALLSFEIRDTGIGMDPDTIEKLFEPFTQADNSSTRAHGGAGLGLAIVQGLVRLMNGQLNVHSNPGKGSIFTVTLPFDTVYDAAEPHSIDPDTLSRKRILIMDDNAVNRRVLRGQLEPADFKLAEATSSAQALELLQNASRDKSPFDIVIVDDRMPDGDGLSFAQQTRNFPELSKLKLILLTSKERSDGLKTLVKAGFSGYLTKPVRGRELLTCIEKMLDTASSSGRFQGLVTRSSLVADRGHGRYQGRVLVVEDNPVNQQVAKRFLERLGCEVKLVDNGERAIEACRSGKFGLVLMDVQMPIMDGLTATRAIRRQENPERRVPIVALTANAVGGENQRCKDAGINEVLAKPLEIGGLRDLLDRYGFRTEATTTNVAILETTDSAESGQPLNLEQLRKVVGDDTEFMRELCETFISSSSRIVEDLAQAKDLGNLAVLVSLAHKLKGGSSSVCADELAALAGQLEDDAKEKPLADLVPTVDAIQKAFTAASAFIRERITA